MGASRLIAVALAMILLVALSSLSAYAVHDDDMQLDGNTADDSLDPNFDWESFFNSVGQESPALPDASRPGFADSVFLNDLADPDPTAFQGGDSKDIKDIGVWQCKTRNLPTNKFQLENTYGLAFRSGSELILYAGGERAAENGDTNIGVWFLKDPTVNCLDTGGAADTFVGHHTDGDTLVLARLVGGGSTAEVDVYEWEGGATGSLNQTGIAEGIKCGDPQNTQDDVCAIANSGTINPPWAPNEVLLSPQFYELGINMTALGLEGCFNRFLTNTRSSHEPNSILHDYALGTLNTCFTLTVGKYIDKDMSGTQNAGDITSGTAVGGWSFEVKNASNVTVCSGTTTSATGTFDCNNLPAGQYTVIETQETGFHNTDPGPIVNRSTTTVSKSVTLTGNQTVRLGNTCYVDVTFKVNNVPASVTSVTAEYSVDAADTPNAGDNPSDGDKTEPVTIALSKSGTTWSGTENDFLTQKDQIDWVWYINGDTAHKVTGQNNVSLSGSGFNTSLADCVKTTEVNFPFASITGFKYKDRDGDGIGPEAGEFGMGTFDFRLMQGGSIVQTVTSSSASGTVGQFTFTNVAPGTYTIVEVSKTGWLQTEPIAGGSYTVTVDLGESSITTDDSANLIEFGNTPLSTIQVLFTSLADLPGTTTDATTSTISCTPDGGPAETDGNYTAGNGTSTLKPGTYTCTVVIVDP